MYLDQKQSNVVVDTTMRSTWKGLESATRVSQPQMKAMMRSQIEMGGFVTKRMQANMELPHRLAKCKSPAEAMAESMSFWLQCVEDYAVTSQRAFQIFGFATPSQTPRIEDWVAPFAPLNVAPRDRDVMDLDTTPTEEAKASKAGAGKSASTATMSEAA